MIKLTKQMPIFVTSSDKAGAEVADLISKPRFCGVQKMKSIFVSSNSNIPHRKEEENTMLKIGEGWMVVQGQGLWTKADFFSFVLCLIRLKSGGEQWYKSRKANKAGPARDQVGVIQSTHANMVV